MQRTIEELKQDNYFCFIAESYYNAAERLAELQNDLDECFDLRPGAWLIINEIVKEHYEKETAMNLIEEKGYTFDEVYALMGALDAEMEEVA